MSEKEFNQIFAKNLQYYLNKYEMTQAELAKRIGVGTTSVYNWVHAIKVPRMSKVDAMCEVFHCRRSDFIMDDAPEAIMLSADEIRLIDHYRQLDERGQGFIDGQISLLLGKKSKDGMEGDVNVG